jgi:hypothetical protein
VVQDRLHAFARDHQQLTEVTAKGTTIARDSGSTGDAEKKASRAARGLENAYHLAAATSAGRNGLTTKSDAHVKSTIRQRKRARNRERSIGSWGDPPYHRPFVLLDLFGAGLSVGFVGDGVQLRAFLGLVQHDNRRVWTRSCVQHDNRRVWTRSCVQ